MNDDSTTGDFYRTGSGESAAGNNNFSGKSPRFPMASLAALVDAYDLDPGDIIYVNTGRYEIPRNITLLADDSGVTIQGPLSEDAIAVLDRGNNSLGSHVFDLLGADHITLSHLEITGGYSGIFAGETSDSEHVTIAGNHIHNNAGVGVGIVGEANRSAQILDNVLHDNNDASFPVGIWVTGPGAVVRSNRLFNETTGINVTSSAEPSIVEDNVIFDGSSVGIFASGNVTLDQNEVSGFRQQYQIAIIASSGTRVRRNVVHDNVFGINISDGTAEANIAFANTVAISLGNNSIADGNQVFANDVGIVFQGYINFGTEVASITHNRVYDNATAAILIEGGNVNGFTNPIIIENNTVVQSHGDAVHVKRGARSIIVRNNILSVASGDAIEVQADSQVDFFSDYNLFQVTGTGQLGRWGSWSYNDRLDWYYDLGFDQHSIAGDPGFVDIDGLDNRLGLGNPISSVRSIGPGDTGFSVSGDWEEPFLDNHAYIQSVPGSAGIQVQWTFDNLVPGEYYQLNASWIPTINLTFDATYEVTDGDRIVGSPNWDQRYESPIEPNLGTYLVQSNRLTVQLAGNVMAGPMTLTPLGRLAALDDNFHTVAGALGNDRGDPHSYFLAEPSPHGDRIDIGAYGNTSEATPSLPNQVQLLWPNGNEKLEAGQQYAIEWQSLSSEFAIPVARINVGNVGPNESGKRVEFWLAELHRTDGSFWGGGSIEDPIDLSQVVAPAPAEVYQSYGMSGEELNDKLRFELPAADGTYTVRLHFVEPTSQSSGERLFDIYLQDQLRADDFDIAATAGGRHVAIAVDYLVTVSDGHGLAIELRNQVPHSAAILSAIELFAVAQPATSPKAAIDVSLDQGATWTTIASDIAMDQYGHGNWSWQIPADWETDGNSARLRVRTTGVGTDTSDTDFLITNGGASYYVNIANDANFTDNEFTTRAGQNRASGKSPEEPMASLWALLRSYDLDPGDKVYVDTGRYLTPDTIRLIAQDSGVTVQGPLLTGHQGIVENRNSYDNNFDQQIQVGNVFDILGSDHVTIDHLTVVGGVNGIYSPSTIDNLHLSHNDIFGSTQTGVLLDLATNSHFHNNRMHDTGNAALSVNGMANIAEHNEVFGTSYGIIFNETASQDGGNNIIRANLVHDNANAGIQVSGRRGIAEDNIVFGHVATNAIGIYVVTGEARSNRVFSNFNGIFGHDVAKISQNHVFDNVHGIFGNFFYGTISGNFLYSNQTAIAFDEAYFDEETIAIANNLIYDNTDLAIQLRNSNGARMINNTIVQSVGDAIDLAFEATQVSLANNVIVVESGYAIKVSDDSQSDFVSDYNDFYLGPNSSGKVGFWNATDYVTLDDWRQATLQDATSLFEDPMLIDINGADNILGYDSSQRMDGSADDNFHLSRVSPLIDRGASANVPSRDLSGAERSDDSATENQGEPVDGTPGYNDLGAFEFQGSRDDTTPPFVVRTTAVLMGTPPDQQTVFHVLFSEALDPIDANASANFDVREAGANGNFGDADDVLIPVVPHYEPGTLLVVLEPANSTVSFQSGKFQVLVSGNSTIHDLSGLRLDGDGDGQEGGNYVRSNRPPVLNPITNLDVPEKQKIDFAVTATDPDDDAITYSAVTLPNGAVLDAASGRFTWTPGEDQGPATYVIIIHATDAGSPQFVAARSVTIQVREVNDPPTISSATAQSATENVLLQFSVAATDPENGSIRYALGTGARPAPYSMP